MEFMTLQEFNNVFKRFIDYYGFEKLSKEKQEIYFLALKDLNKEEFQTGFIRIVKDREYTNFPSIAEIRKYSLWLKEQDIETRIHIAKEKLKVAIKVYGAYQTVGFDDPNIHAVIDSLGGWLEVCTMNIEDLNKFITFEFKKVYRAYLQVSYNINSKYLGIHDKENEKENLVVVGNQKQYLDWNQKNIENINLLGDHSKFKAVE